MTRNDVGPTPDRRILRSYLADHLTGAEGGRARALDMADRYASDRAVGPTLRTIAEQIDEEHDALAGIIDDLGLRQPLPARVVARAGEVVGRLKPNGRLLTSTPMTPLLEIELLRAAVNGKRGMWQTLADHAAVLGLSAQEMTRRAEQARRQTSELETVHARLRAHAFSPDG